MLFFFLATAFATTYKYVQQQDTYTVCAEITFPDTCSTVASVVGMFGLEAGTCVAETAACPEWMSQTKDFTNELGALTAVCADFTYTLKCMGTVPEVPVLGDLDTSQCGTDALSCIPDGCSPSSCADFQSTGCASCLTDCVKSIFESLTDDTCNLVELPDLGECGESVTTCIPDGCSPTLCASYAEGGCATCVSDCVSKAVGQAFNCAYVESMISQWTDYDFASCTDTDVTGCIENSNCEIPTDCADYQSKVSAGGCASCLGDCGRTVVASTIDSCDAILQTWADLPDMENCSPDVTCLQSSCAMPKDCSDYQNKLSSGGCANCLGDCARQVLANTIDGCSFVAKQLNGDSGSVGLSFALALVGSFLYNF